MNPFAPFILLLKNILAGTRAALFMPMHLWAFSGRFGQVCLLLLLSFFLSFIYDYFTTLPDNFFNPYGISYQAMLYFFFFFSLSLLACFKSRQKDLEKLFIMFLSVVPVVWLGTVCLLELVKYQTVLDTYESSWVVFVLYTIWYLLIALRLFKRFFYINRLSSFAFMLLYAVINFAPLFLLPSQPLWQSMPDTDNNSMEKVKSIDIESVYYRQNDLVEQITDELLEERATETDLYFIGFAGDANEDVFMNEVIAAQGILQDKFATHGRSSILVNNAATVNRIPLANKYNLRKVINKTAAKMNLDEDVLILFLTSHGSESHTLSAEFYPFKLNDIDPESVGKWLDTAGIKWRIIIVSACYSGGFIEPLSNANTLLITAARKDRNSFGCGHDGTFTYFGEAYFEQALKQTRSFVEAYDIAKEIIYKKENEQGFKNSEPQISIGKEMEKKLNLLQQQLETKKHTNWASTSEDLFN